MPSFMAQNCEKWCDKDFVLCGNMGWKVIWYSCL